MMPIGTLDEKTAATEFEKEVARIFRCSNPHEHLKTLQSYVQEEKIDVNWQDGGGQTILHIAAEQGALDLIRLAHQKGASMNQQTHSPVSSRYWATPEATPMQYAARGGQPKAMRLLIELGAIATDSDWDLLNQTASEIAQMFFYNSSSRYRADQRKYQYTIPLSTLHEWDQTTFQRAVPSPESDEFCTLMEPIATQTRSERYTEHLKQAIESRREKDMKIAAMADDPSSFLRDATPEQKKIFCLFFEGINNPGLNGKSSALLSHLFSKKETDEHQPLIANDPEALQHLLTQMSRTKIGTQAAAIYIFKIGHATALQIERTEKGLQVSQVDSTNAYASDLRLNLHSLPDIPQPIEFKLLKTIQARQRDGQGCKIFAFKDARLLLKANLSSQIYTAAPIAFLKGMQNASDQSETLFYYSYPETPVNRAGNSLKTVYQKHSRIGTNRQGENVQKNQYSNRFYEKYRIWVASCITQVLSESDTPEQAKMRLKDMIAQYDAAQITIQTLECRHQSSQRKRDAEQRLKIPPWLRPHIRDIEYNSNPYEKSKLNLFLQLEIPEQLSVFLSKIEPALYDSFECTLQLGVSLTAFFDVKKIVDHPDFIAQHPGIQSVSKHISECTLEEKVDPEDRRKQIFSALEKLFKKDKHQLLEILTCHDLPEYEILFEGFCEIWVRNAQPEDWVDLVTALKLSLQKDAKNGSPNWKIIEKQFLFISKNPPLRGCFSDNNIWKKLLDKAFFFNKKDFIQQLLNSQACDPLGLRFDENDTLLQFAIKYPQHYDPQLLMTEYFLSDPHFLNHENTQGKTVFTLLSFFKTNEWADYFYLNQEESKLLIQLMEAILKDSNPHELDFFKLLEADNFYAVTELFGFNAPREKAFYRSEEGARQITSQISSLLEKHFGTKDFHGHLFSFLPTKEKIDFTLKQGEEMIKVCARPPYFFDEFEKNDAVKNMARDLLDDEKESLELKAALQQDETGSVLRNLLPLLNEPGHFARLIEWTEKPQDIFAIFKFVDTGADNVTVYKSRIFRHCAWVQPPSSADRSWETWWSGYINAKGQSVSPLYAELLALGKHKLLGLMKDQPPTAELQAFLDTPRTIWGQRRKTWLRGHCESLQRLKHPSQYPEINLEQEVTTFMRKTTPSRRD